MVLRIYLFSLYLTLFLSFGLLSLIFFNVNPYTSPVWMIFLLYFSFFLFWMSFFGVIGFYLKIWASNREVIFAHLLPTLRQSVLMGIALTGLLFLFQIKVLSWWVAVLFILAVLMIELYFRKK
ncbi:MAG: hypothetical protein US31_C0007G0043 [Berkelbacteria bacterium GW2011_GWA1_36_9]|uniref:Integral membrane protein n=1 Tax=Berkelbacteria bacterium GW2011_GWA1_36_9 TaxID=1618331 RepID=A0A0G0FKJ6_9BACT|nr:MAG: hypothetical protein US31_C0007G0043 [Berkelbacteria bacterium GW2011_GWA1_36_9]